MPQMNTMKPLPTLPATGFVRKKQLIPHIIPIGSTTLDRWVKDGRFPRGTRITARVTAWRAEDIRDWLDAQQREAGK